MDILIDPLFSDLNNNKVPVIPDNIFKRKNPEKYTQKFLQALIEASLQDVLQCFFFIFERFKIKQFCLIITRSIYGGAYTDFNHHIHHHYHHILLLPYCVLILRRY